MRILVAEDHPTLGSSLKEGLEECYYAVDLVTNGEEAYELGRVIHYDLSCWILCFLAATGWRVSQALARTAAIRPFSFSPR